MNKEPEIINNTEEQRYEIHVGDEVAALAYEHRGQEILFLHTSVPPALEHHGIGSSLVHTALEDARAENLTVVPLCPFVTKYIRSHPEYQSLVNKTNQ